MSNCEFLLYFIFIRLDMLLFLFSVQSFIMNSLFVLYPNTFSVGFLFFGHGMWHAESYLSDQVEPMPAPHAPWESQSLNH